MYSLMSSRLYVQRYQEQLVKNVMAQAEYLKNNLLENHMTLDDPQDLNLRIEGVATAFSRQGACDKPGVPGDQGYLWKP